MKNLSYLINEYQNLLAKKFYDVDSISECSKIQSDTIKLAADIKAHHDVVLPDDPVKYSKYNISDFNGFDELSTSLMEPKVALKAKLGIAEYCWNISSAEMLKELEEDPLSLVKRSVLGNRLKNGQNVIVYGEPKKSVISGDANNLKVHISKNPKGMTMAAALIMKEAINMRSISKEFLSQTYAWISYRRLRQYLLDRNIEKLAEYKYSDWLVIDDVVYEESSERQQSMFASLLDTFFQERMDEKLCNIFVCKFNVKDTTLDLDSQFGLAIDKIINSRKTFLISL